MPPKELNWDEIASAFGGQLNWWVTTSGSSGPHAVPVWGVVVDGQLCFYGDATAVRSRNLAQDSRLVLHLEDGDAPLIVHGRARLPQPTSTQPEVAAAFREKYGDTEYLPDNPALGDPSVYVVDAERAIAWDLNDDYPNSERRWRANARTT